MMRWSVAAAAVALVAGVAHADTPSDFVKRHTSSGGNVDAIMADYADDAVVLQNGRAIQGKAEIRKLFAAMFAPRAKAAPPAAGAAPAQSGGAGGPPAGGGMKVTKVWEEGNVGFMTWEAGPMHTTEEFIIKDGKIVVQAIFMTGMGPGGSGGAPPARPTP